jgi:hypothetical protein
MQRQGAFAFFHQSANAGKMVNLHEKIRKWWVLCEVGQEMRTPSLPNAAWRS